MSPTKPINMYQRALIHVMFLLVLSSFLQVVTFACQKSGQSCRYPDQTCCHGLQCKIDQPITGAWPPPAHCKPLF